MESNLTGRLLLVGTGPGAANLTAPAAIEALHEADLLIGYGLYIDLLDPDLSAKNRLDFELGQETERCRAALDHAAKGQTVALVCSGDSGIYAMGALVFELVDKEQRPEWLALDIVSVPGITAMQTLSNRVGAPMGHDFCAISMSDLLTPWDTIVQRLEGAALGDFVVGFYNPVSKKRDWQLNFARDLLLKHRSADTPVIIGRNLGRDGETVTVLTLGELEAANVDMFCVVIVGSSQSQTIEIAGTPRVYTPRGYAKKNVEEWS